MHPALYAHLLSHTYILATYSHGLQAGSPRPLYLRLQEEFERKQLAEAEEYRKKVEAISKAAHVSGCSSTQAELLDNVPFTVNAAL